MKIEDKNEQESFHPSLDIKHGISLLGFKIKKEKGKEENIYILTTKDGTQVLEGDSFDCDEKHYRIDIKDRNLNRLSRKWSAVQVNALIETLNTSLGVDFKGKELYFRLKEALRKYVVLENESDYSILTAWIMGTYVFPIFSAYPYIHIKAPKGSGKTQCLTFIEETAFNGVKVISATFPSFRDTVDSLRGTYLVDQGDKFNRKYMEEFLDVLTGSYKKLGGDIRKNIPTKYGWELQEFQAYSPKGFASIEELPEDLRDRCVVIPLIRVDSKNGNISTIDLENSIWRSLRNELYILPIDQHVFISAEYLLVMQKYKENGEIFGRQLELWSPIETMLNMYSPEETKTAKTRFSSHYAFAEYQTSELEVAIIETIMKMLGDENEAVLRPKEIVEKVDSGAFEDETTEWGLSLKQKAAKVGRAVSKFNLASEKQPRDKYGEKYLFTKERLEKVYEGYFKNKEEPTLSYTPSITIEKQDVLGGNSNSIF